MVIKTGICVFSEFRIYPGHGSTFVRRDGQPLTFLNSKTKNLYHLRKKCALIHWTTAWRRLHKKDQVSGDQKKRKNRARKYVRAVVGASKDDLKKKKTEKPEVRAAAREAALREIKEREKAKKSAKKPTTTAAAPKKAKK